MIISKQKNIRLRGKALRELCERVWERDKYRCIICGKYIGYGYKPHHVFQAANKSDEEEKMVTLCNECHYECHHGFNIKGNKQKCLDYLNKIYGNDKGEN